MDTTLFLQLKQLLHERIPCALLTVISSHGSAPGRTGFKMLVGADGSLLGTIGGGVMEFELVAHARELLASGLRLSQSFIRLHNRSAAPDQRSGMICSGGQRISVTTLFPDAASLAFSQAAAAAFSPCSAVSAAPHLWLKINAEGVSLANLEQLEELPLGKSSPPSQPGAFIQPFLFSPDQSDWLYLEPLQIPDTLYVIGAGHVGLAVCRALQPLDFRILLFDDRPQLPTFLENPYAHEKHITTYDRIAEWVQPGKHGYVVIVTTAFTSDAEALAHLLPLDWHYIGLMGSATKIGKIRAELLQRRIDMRNWSRLHAPIGLPLPNRTPAEIAVSIAAEIIQVRNPSRNRGNS